MHRRSPSPSPWLLGLLLMAVPLPALSLPAEPDTRAEPAAARAARRQPGTGPAKTATKQPPGAEETPAAILARVRRATGYEALARHENGVLLAGTARFAGLEQEYRLRFSPDGRFLRTIEGRFGEQVGFDGKRAWATDWSGMPRALELEELEVWQLAHAVLTGRWLAADTPFHVALRPGADDAREVELVLRLATGRLRGRLAVDRATWLPASLRFSQGGEPTVFRFADYRRAAGGMLPHRVEHAVRDLTHVYRVATAAEAPPSAGDPYAFAAAPLKNTTFDPAVSPVVETRRTRTGHLVVRPRVDGKPAGWFLLDSGAWVTVITPAAADAAGMQSFGAFAAAGVGGTVRTRFREGVSFQLGPLAIARPTYVELDLSEVSEGLGVPLAGICGYDVFSRAVVVVDAAAGAVEVHQPERYRLEAGEWRPLQLDNRLPCVPCEFEGYRQGLFTIDTGSSGTLTFDPASTNRFGLLEGRQTQEGMAAGVGGHRPVRDGRLQWFELAGTRFDRVGARFSLPHEGAYASPYTAGRIGLGLLAPFRLVFDYPRRRIAFVRREPAEAPRARGRQDGRDG